VENGNGRGGGTSGVAPDLDGSGKICHCDHTIEQDHRGVDNSCFKPTLFNLRTTISFALVCAAAVSVHADIITVITTADSGPGSLRQALADAQDGDTIQFDAALNGQTIGLESSELVIDKNITISGPGPGLLTVARSQQAADFRIFNIPPSHTAEIDGLTITGGSLVGNGGGISSGATLTISNCAISGNSITADGVEYSGAGIITSEP